MNATTVGINPPFPEREKNALTILQNLELEDFNHLKRAMNLSNPGEIGPQTLATFVALCARLNLDLSDAGVNQFKDAQGLGNDGELRGVIGPETAEVYYDTVLVLLDRTAVSNGSFPFASLPSVDWTSGIRRFAADRSNGTRAHAGCDLYFPAGTWIHAVEDGTVTAGPYPFYQGTYALEVDHGSFLVRYGEIQASAPVSDGDTVSQGQRIARVGDLVGITASMLHFEMYDKSETGRLTRPASQSKRRADGVPFMRRRDLIDPTPSLNAWRNSLP